MFAGCAASSFRTARENANQVKNGMTVQQAEAILGMPATDKTADKVKWRRGNALRYDATPNGSVEFTVENGVIVGVPEGGVFGPVARQAYVQKRAEEQAHSKPRKRPKTRWRPPGRPHRPRQRKYGASGTMRKPGKTSPRRRRRASRPT